MSVSIAHLLLPLTQQLISSIIAFINKDRWAFLLNFKSNHIRNIYVG